MTREVLPARLRLTWHWFVLATMLGVLVGCLLPAPRTEPEFRPYAAPPAHGVEMRYAPSSWVRPAIGCRYSYAPYLATQWHCPRVM